MTQDEKKELYRVEAVNALNPLLNLGLIVMLCIPISLVLLIWIDWLICIKIFATSVILFFCIAGIYKWAKGIAIKVADKYAASDIKPKTGKFHKKMEDMMEAARIRQGLS